MINALKKSGSLSGWQLSRAIRVSLILQKYNPGLRDEERRTSIIVTSMFILTLLN